MNFYTYPNRVVCSVLDEMREGLKQLCSDNLDIYIRRQAMLLEEAQTLVNRMEAALEDADDITRAHKKIKELKKEIAELEEKK